MDSPEINDPNTERQLKLSFTDGVLGSIFVLITALYALLMLRDRVPTLGLVALAGLWLIYAILKGKLSAATAMDVPILLLGLMLPLSLAISVDWQLSLPKIIALVLSLALYYLIVNYLRSYAHLPLVIFGLILLAVAVAVLGLVSADWSGDRMFTLTPIYSRLPRLLSLAAGAGYESGINVNTIGGAMTFFVPLLLSLFWDEGSFSRKYLAGRPSHKAMHAAYKTGIALALGVVLITLLLTQSRGAYLGTLVGLVVFAVWKDRRLALVALALVLIAFVVLMVWTNGDLAGLITRLDTDEEGATLPGRLQAWRRTSTIIQDFPLTGTGIGTYSLLYDQVYSFNVFPETVETTLQAHNTFLSAAADLGLPGLVLYSALLSIAVAAAIKTVKYGRTVIRVVLIGLISGLVGHHVFGTMDTFSLGTKLGAILWIYLGVISAFLAHRKAFHWRKGRYPRGDFVEEGRGIDWDRFKAHLVDGLIGVGLWALFSLTALTFANLDITLSLALAGLLGIALGIILTARFTKNSTRMDRRTSIGPN